MGLDLNQVWPGWPVLALVGLVLLAGGLFSIAGSASGPGDAEPLDTMLVVLPSGGEVVVELAVTPAQRSRGLMFRDELPAEQGMLLVFPDTGFRSIWMKNVRFPLDLIWLDSSNMVVHLEEHVPPCASEPCPDYHSLRQASSVLELNAGAVKRLQIKLGDRLEFIPPLP